MPYISVSNTFSFDFFSIQDFNFLMSADNTSEICLQYENYHIFYESAKGWPTMLDVDSHVIWGGLDYVSRRWNWRTVWNGSEKAFVIRTSCQLVSLRVLERIYGARSGEQGPHNEIRRCERWGCSGRTLAYLTEKSSSLLPRHLNKRKTSDGESASKKGRKKESTVEIEEPF